MPIDIRRKPTVSPHFDGVFAMTSDRKTIIPIQTTPSNLTRNFSIIFISFQELKNICIIAQKEIIANWFYKLFQSVDKRLFL